MADFLAERERRKATRNVCHRDLALALWLLAKVFLLRRMRTCPGAMPDANSRVDCLLRLPMPESSCEAKPAVAIGLKVARLSVLKESFASEPASPVAAAAALSRYLVEGECEGGLRAMAMAMVRAMAMAMARVRVST